MGKDCDLKEFEEVVQSILSGVQKMQKKLLEQERKIHWLDYENQRLRSQSRVGLN